MYAWASDGRYAHVQIPDGWSYLANIERRTTAERDHLVTLAGTYQLVQRNSDDPVQLVARDDTVVAELELSASDVLQLRHEAQWSIIVWSERAAVVAPLDQSV